ncbi:hypothetical protein [Streptomyces sp. NTH33]|uniref:hypothetical protein n=1 Tax=Streptomyces sp. NTH33 TaxID=1735453 RepID=UPI0011B94997|nr:hypothetical protein [Streptomyces sp. NTH33]
MRDRTFREDDSKVRTGRLPRAMASLRNLALCGHRRNGDRTIAAAVRHAARDSTRPITALGRTSRFDEIGQADFTQRTLAQEMLKFGSRHSQRQ